MTIQLLPVCVENGKQRNVRLGSSDCWRRGRERERKSNQDLNPLTFPEVLHVRGLGKELIVCCLLAEVAHRRGTSSPCCCLLLHSRPFLPSTTPPRMRAGPPAMTRAPCRLPHLAVSGALCLLPLPRHRRARRIAGEKPHYGVSSGFSLRSTLFFSFLVKPTHPPSQLTTTEQMRAVEVSLIELFISGM